MYIYACRGRPFMASKKMLNSPYNAPSESSCLLSHSAHQNCVTRPTQRSPIVHPTLTHYAPSAHPQYSRRSHTLLAPIYSLGTLALAGAGATPVLRRQRGGRQRRLVDGRYRSPHHRYPARGTRPSQHRSTRPRAPRRPRSTPVTRSNFMPRR